MRSTLDFINRTNDFNNLLHQIRPLNSQESNKVVILCGDTGIGKSRFVTEFFNRYFQGYTKVKVASLGTSSASIDSLFFFNRIYEEILNVLEPSPRKKIPFSLTGIGIGIGIASASIEFEENGDYDRQTIKRYKYIVKSLGKKDSRFIIDIENAHLFDAASFRLLSSILKQTVGNSYILEYTTGYDVDKCDLYKLIGALESIGHHVEIDVYNLEKLSLADAKRIYENVMPSNSNLDMIEQVYSTSNGNLLDIYLLPNVKHVEREKNVVRSVIEELNNNEKTILYIIYLNKGAIKISLLYLILENNDIMRKVFTPLLVREVLDNLSEKKLVHIELDTVIIKHDSILAEIDRNKGEMIYYNAYAIIESFYSNSIEQNDNAVLMLLYLYTLINDPKILNIIPYIQNIALKQRYPEAILEKMNDIYLALNNNGHNKLQLSQITIAMVEVLYLCGYYDKALDKLSLIFDSSNPIHIAFKGAILALRNKDDDLQNLMRLIDENSQNLRLKLILEIHLLIAYMETKLSSESEALAERLLEIDEYKHYLEYIFLLENYSEFKSNEKALEILTHCVNSYKTYNRPDLAIRCMISIASRKAYMGNYDDAEEILLTVEQNYDNISLRHEYLLNNKAAIRILKNDFSEYTEQLLCDAIILSLNGYERIIILSNLLIVYTANKKFEMARQIAEELESSLESTHYKYEELTHILLQNLRYFFYSTGNIIALQKYNDNLSRLKDKNVSAHLKYYIDATLSGIPINDVQHQWFNYSALQYRPDFLGYWQFEIPKDLF